VSFHNGVGLVVQGGVMIGSWDVIVQGVVARLELVLKGWRSEKSAASFHAEYLVDGEFNLYNEAKFHQYNQ